MEEIAQVYARALFEVAQERDQLDEIRAELGQFVDALNQYRQLAIFLFSPYFSSEEKKAGLRRVIEGGDEAFMNFLEVLVERHRMPVIFRIQARYEALWDEANRLLPVQVTSATRLDESTVTELGRRIREQAGKEIELTSNVDPAILGGIVLRVGNFILDASIRNRLEQLRKQVAQA
jgi:F-type H+-transporting ATPase subunit delta